MKPFNPDSVQIIIGQVTEYHPEAIQSPGLHISPVNLAIWIVAAWFVLAIVIIRIQMQDHE